MNIAVTIHHIFVLLVLVDIVPVRDNIRVVATVHIVVGFFLDVDVAAHAVILAARFVTIVVILVIVVVHLVFVEILADVVSSSSMLSCEYIMMLLNGGNNISSD